MSHLSYVVELSLPPVFCRRMPPKRAFSASRLPRLSTQLTSQTEV